MRHTLLAALFLPLFASCAGTDTPDDSDTDVAPVDDTEETDVTADSDTGTGDSDDTGEVQTDYAGGRYIITELRIAREGVGVDVTGDGEPDNRVAELLALFDDFVGGNGTYSVQSINNNIAYMLATESAIVLLDVTYDPSAPEPNLGVAVLQGARDGVTLGVLPSSFDESGDPVSFVEGKMVRSDRFSAGPGPLTVPLVFEIGLPSITVAAPDAWMGGEIDFEHVDGNIGAAVSGDSIVEGVVRPLAEDIYGAGSEQANEYIQAASDLVDSLSDLTIDGEPAVSAAFTFKAEDVTWVQP